MLKNKIGFTLIELLVVVLIIGVLAAIALPQYYKSLEKSRASEALSVINTVCSAMERAKLAASDQRYPSSFSALDIQMSDKDGNPVEGSTWETKNFSFSISTGGIVTATRPINAYNIRKTCRSGRIQCEDSTYENVEDYSLTTDGVCASLGLS